MVRLVKLLSESSDNRSGICTSDTVAANTVDRGGRGDCYQAKY